MRNNTNQYLTQLAHGDTIDNRPFSILYHKQIIDKKQKKR